MSISHIIVPNPQSSTRSKMMMTIKTNTQKKSHEKDFKKKRSFKSKEDIKAFLGEWITDGESSSDDSSDDKSKKKIVGIAMHDDGDDEPPLPPPPMCLMASVTLR